MRDLSYCGDGYYNESEWEYVIYEQVRAAAAALICVFIELILNTNKIQEKICAEILYMRDYRLDFSKF